MKDTPVPKPKPQPGKVELFGKDLPKRLLAKLAQYDKLMEYRMVVCHEDQLPYVRLSNETIADIRDWSERKLNIIADPLMYRNRPVINEHAPVPAFELASA